MQAYVDDPSTLIGKAFATKWDTEEQKFEEVFLVWAMLDMGKEKRATFMWSRTHGRIALRLVELFGAYCVSEACVVCCSIVMCTVQGLWNGVALFRQLSESWPVATLIDLPSVCPVSNSEPSALRVLVAVGSHCLSYSMVRLTCFSPRRISFWQLDFIISASQDCWSRPDVTLSNVARATTMALAWTSQLSGPSARHPLAVGPDEYNQANLSIPN